MAADQELIIKISGTAKDFTDELDRVRKKTEDLERSLSKVAKISSAAFIGVVGAAAAATQSFVAYERALVGVGKTTNIEGKQLENLGLSFQKLSQEIPIATNELLGIAQAGGQLGVSGEKNLLKFTETVAKLGFATDLTGEQAATALARIINVTGESISEVDKLGSVIVKLGNNFAASESEITRVATEVSRSTAVFKVSSAQAVALSAAMKSLGIQAQLGGSAVGRTFREIDASIRQGGSRLQELSNITGIAADQLKKRFAEDSVGVFQAFIEGLKLVSEEGGSTTATLEKFGLKGDEINKVIPVLALGADQLGTALRFAAEETANATALNEEAGRAFATVDAEQKKLFNSLGNLATRIGGELAPSYKEIVVSLKDFVNGILDGDNATVKTIATFLKYTGIITGAIAVISTLALTYIKLRNIIAATTEVLAKNGIELSANAIKTNLINAAQKAWNINLAIGDALLKPFTVTLNLFGSLLGPIASKLLSLTNSQNRNNLITNIQIKLWELYANTMSFSRNAIKNLIAFLNPLTAVQRIQNAAVQLGTTLQKAYDAALTFSKKNITAAASAIRALFTIQNIQAIASRAAAIATTIFSNAVNVAKFAVRGLAGATGIGLILVAISLLIDNFDKVQAVASGTFAAVSKAVQIFAKNALSIFGSLGDLLKAVFTFDFDEIKSSYGKLKDQLGKTFEDIGKESGKAFNDAYNKSIESSKTPELNIPELPTGDQSGINLQDPEKEARKLSDKLTKAEEDRLARVREIRNREAELSKLEFEKEAKDRIEIKDEELKKIADQEKEASDAVIKIKQKQLEVLKEIDALETKNAELNDQEKISKKEQAEIEANENLLNLRRQQLAELQAVEVQGNEILELEQKERDQRKLERIQEQFEEEQALKEELNALTQEQRDALDEEDILKAQTTIQTKRDIEKAAATEQLQENIKRRNQFLKDEIKFGTEFAKIRQFFSGQEILLADQTAGQLVQLTQSKNAQLKAIGKAAALVQIGIKTAEGAISAYSALAGIPIVGPALGAIAAGALIAFGTEQAAAVTAAQRGGIVPNGNGGSNDRIPALLQPGELVVPAPLAPDFIQAVGRPDPESGVGGSQTQVIIGFTDEAIPYIEQKLLERRAIGTGSL